MSNPGDIQVSSFTIKTASGTLDLTYSFVSASIYESIFTPGIVMYVKVLDTDDQVGIHKIVGGEPVSISLGIPGGVKANYKFTVMQNDNTVGATASMKSKMYMLKMVSDEVIHGHINTTIKSADTQISNLVQQIHKDLLHSTKNLIVEDTQGNQHLSLNGGMSAHEAIAMIRKRAMSAENKSSLFVFFETRQDSETVFKFSTIENLFKCDSVKTFQQSDAINSSIYNQTDNQIIAMEIPTHFNTMERIKKAASDVIEFDYTTWQYTKKRIVSNPTDYTTGGTGNMISADVFDKFINAAKNLPQLFVPTDNYKRAVTHIPEKIQDRNSYLSTLSQNSIKIRTYGDLAIKAGDVITLNIPTRSSTTDNKKNDSQLSGKFLVSRIHHDIGLVSESPRYTCVIECIKGNIETGVQ
jgi:hypothetical protein